MLCPHTVVINGIVIGYGQDESGMFDAPGAGGAVGASAGHADLCEGLDSGPELLELAEEMLAER